MCFHKLSLLQIIVCNKRQVEAREARDWPSNLVKRWFSIISE